MKAKYEFSDPLLKKIFDLAAELKESEIPESGAILASVGLGLAYGRYRGIAVIANHLELWATHQRKTIAKELSEMAAMPGKFAQCAKSKRDKRA